MKITFVAMVFFSVLFVTNWTYAGCDCTCVNGEVRAICSSALDVETICTPYRCPVVPPSIEPIQQPRVQSIGTSTCDQRQIYNEVTRQPEWREVCD
jgi:hypothetical protein